MTIVIPTILLSLWKWAIIPLVILSLVGFLNKIQEGGPEKGSQIWAPIAWIFTVAWILIFVIKGVSF